MKKIFFLLTGVLFILLFLGCPNTTETPSETPKSNNANLQFLTLSTGSLSPAFDETTIIYSVTVPYETTSLTITGKTADSKATMDPENGVVTVDNLVVGETKETIKVTAEDGTEKTYTITVIRKAASSNADLQSLEVSDNFSHFSLDSAFDAGIFDYTVTVPYATKSLTITGVTADSKATMEPENGVVTLNDLKVDEAQSATIKVKAEDGTEKTYTVTVTRKAGSSNANLQFLIPSTSTLNPDFSPTETNYMVSVPYATTRLTVKGTKDNANATMEPENGVVTVNDLKVEEEQTATITVTSEDGTTTKEYKVKVVRQPRVEMLLVPAGSFQCDKNETMISKITKPYSLSKYPITRQQFKDVMGVDPSDTAKSSGMTDPVQMVSWYYAIAFCNKLSIKEGLSPAYSVKVRGTEIDWANLAVSSIPTSSSTAWDLAECNWAADGYRLPTEMEWMWAAMGADQDAREGVMQNGINRTGYTKAYAGEGYGDAFSIGDYAWSKGNSGSRTHPVGKKLSNELGLYDMSGNVMEWCWDWKNDYPSGLEIDYKGADSGSYRVCRGGDWSKFKSDCTVAKRNDFDLYLEHNYNGFRILRPDLQGLRASVSEKGTTVVIHRRLRLL